MFFYRCSFSDIHLDIKCAFLLHNIDANFRKLKYVAHEHPLTFIQNPNDELQLQLQKANCYWCQKPLVKNDSLFVCLNCQFHLHKKCAQLPTKLIHPCHRKHILYIEDACLLCSLCQKQHWSLFYRCLPCNFDIDIECFLSMPYSITEDDNHHEHSFTSYIRDESFVCDACGNKGTFISYICPTCHINVHKECKSFPRIIRTTRHPHIIVHNYFFQRKELEKYNCGICLSEVEYGSYTCLEKDCDYVAHVNCALEMDMYDVIDQVNDEEDKESSEHLATNSSITCVVETNEQGEAAKIKHFSHADHDLTLCNNLNEDEDKHCDGCMLIISDSFYYCSQCDCEFLLHKTCAELPRKQHRWLDHSLRTLELKDFFKCRMCERVCSGLCYKKDEDDNRLCLRCCRISQSDTLNFTRKGHKHSFIYDFNFYGRCSACCGRCGKGAYRCKDCSFAVEFACITLPQETQHKCDKHFLKLTTVHGDQIDNAERNYCDICEEERDPKCWFYHCSICDTFAHPKCALENFPFYKTKIESIVPSKYVPWWADQWPCDFKFVEIAYNNICHCHHCGKPCRDVALQCKGSRWNYVVHRNCWNKLGI